MRYVYPVVFTKSPEGYDVQVPDLPGCFSCGESLVEAINMARDAMSMRLCDAENKGEAVPAASEPEDVQHDVESFINLVDAHTDEYRRGNDNKAVKKTLSIPSWLNTKAERAGVNFSQVLQEGLRGKLGIK